MSFNFLNHSFLLWSSPSRKPDLISAFIHIFHCTYSWSYFWVLTDYFIVFYNMQRKLAKTTRQRDLINDSICLRTVSFKSWGEYYLVCSQQSVPTLLHFLFKPTPKNPLSLQVGLPKTYANLWKLLAWVPTQIQFQGFQISRIEWWVLKILISNLLVRLSSPFPQRCCRLWPERVRPEPLGWAVGVF